MKESNRVRKLFIAFAIFVLGIPAIASAVPNVIDEGNNVVRVSYAGLDLSTERGLVVLYNRLKNASKAACGTQSYRQAGSLAQVMNNRYCYKNLLSRLVVKVNNVKLDAIHTG